MEIFKTIEKFVGRKLGYDEVILEEDNQGTYILEWNIVDPMPTAQQILDTWTIYETEITQDALNHKSDIDNLSKATIILAKLTFQEINKLRVLHSLTAYTWQQFKTAFRNEWNA